MISEMAGPICVKLSVFVGAKWEIVLGKKNFEIEFFFFDFFFLVLVPEPYLISAHVTTRVRNSNLGLCFFTFKCCVSQLSVDQMSRNLVNF